MSSDPIYDVVVVGGGPVGLASAYQVAKEGRSVIVLERRNFFNQAEAREIWRECFAQCKPQQDPEPRGNLGVDLRSGTQKTSWQT